MSDEIKPWEHWKLKTPEERKAIAAKGVATRRRNRAEEARQREEEHSKFEQTFSAIRLIEERLAKLQRMEALTFSAMSLTRRSLLTEQEIVDASEPWKKISGVYFLIKGNEVVYVGQSVHIPSRICGHSDKDFDRYAYVPCPPEALDQLESLYIHVLRPKLNGEQSWGGMAAPISLETLLGMK